MGAKIVGLTGGIATGKSAVARILAERFGAVIIDSDVLAREVVEPGEPAYEAIVSRWGPQILTADGRVDRRKLGFTVFTSEADRAALNGIVHPRVRELSRIRLKEARALEPPGPLIVLVIPLLFEAGLEGEVDEIWVVRATAEQQLERLLARDGLTEADARARIESQMPIGEKVARAHHVIDNGGSLEHLEEAVGLAVRTRLPS